jgi:HAUS augmin-like complex subunit 1
MSRLLDVLSEISFELDIDDPKPAQLSLLLSELQLECAKIPMDQFERNRREEEKKENKLRALKDVSRNTRVMQSVSNEVKRGQVSSSQSTKKLEFLKEKQREYGKTSERAESNLRKAGFSKEVMHERLVELRVELDEAEKEVLTPLRRKLESYRDLPPDMELARVKVAEAERELERLTHALTKEIQVMHV